MTCKQMGGGCDDVVKGETAQEMMNNGAKHLQESTNDEDKKALAMMNDMQNDPEAGRKWNEDFERKFAELPQD